MFLYFGQHQGSRVSRFCCFGSLATPAESEIKMRLGLLCGMSSFPCFSTQTFKNSLCASYLREIQAFCSRVFKQDCLFNGFDFRVPTTETTPWGRVSVLLTLCRPWPFSRAGFVSLPHLQSIGSPSDVECAWRSQARVPEVDMTLLLKKEKP